MESWGTGARRLTCVSRGTAGILPLQPPDDFSDIVVGIAHTIVILVQKLLRLRQILQTPGMFGAGIIVLVIPHIDLVGAILPKIF